MKNTFAIILFSWFSTLTILGFPLPSNNGLSSQETRTADSLKKIIAFTNQDTTRIKTILSLSKIYNRYNSDTAIYLCHQAKQLSAKIKDRNLFSNSFILSGWAYYKQSNYPEALSDFKNGLMIKELMLKNFYKNENTHKKEILNTRNNICNTLGYIGIIYDEQGDFTTALHYYFRALKIAEEINDKEKIADHFGLIGTIYMSLGNYPKSLEFSFKSLKLREELGNENDLAMDLGNIGNNYAEQGNYDKAIEYYQKALPIIEKQGDKNALATLLSNIGNVYDNQGNNANALEHHYKAIGYAKETGNKGIIAAELGNIATTYYTMGRRSKENFRERDSLYNRALEFYSEALKIDEEIGRKRGMTIKFFNLGILHLNWGKFIDAEMLLNKSLTLAEEIGSTDDISTAHQNLSWLYDTLAFVSGSNSKKHSSEYLKLSIEHFSNFSDTKYALFNEDKSREMGRLEQKSVFDLAELKRQQEEKEAAVAEALAVGRRNKLEYSAIFISIFLLFVLVFFLGRFKLPDWAIELSVFLPVLIFFEFTLVLLDAQIEILSGSKPMYKLFINVLLALFIFPLHHFIEKLFRKRLLSDTTIKSTGNVISPIAFLFIFIFISCLHSGFTDKKDSLVQIINQSKKDTVQVDALNTLSFELNRSLPDSSISLAETAIKLSRKLNYKNGLIRAYNNLGGTYMTLGEYTRSVDVFEKSLRVAESTTDVNLRAKIIGNIGIAYQNQGMADKALDYYFKALKIKSDWMKHLRKTKATVDSNENRQNKNGLTSTLLNIGNVYNERSNFPLALKFYFSALKIKTEINDLKGMGILFGNIANLYYKMNNQDTALHFYFKSIGICNKINDKSGLAANYSNIASIYSDRHEVQYAEEYCLKALKINEETGNKNGVARNLLNLGIIYSEQKMVKKAEDYLLRALRMQEEMGDKRAVCIVQGHLGSLYTEAGNFPLAENYLSKSLFLSYSLKLLDKTQLFEEKYSRLLWLNADNSYHAGNYTVSSGLFKNSLEHFKKSIKARDSIFNDEKEKEVGKTEAQYELEMQKLQQRQKEKEAAVAVALALNRRNKLEYSGMFIGIFILFSVIFFVGKFNLPVWAVELSAFIPFLILFEFILVLLDPTIEKFSGGEPFFKLVINVSLAVIIFPLHGFLEKRMKGRMLVTKSMK